jgi:hypothetical protein
MVSGSGDEQRFGNASAGEVIGPLVFSGSRIRN